MSIKTFILKLLCFVIALFAVDYLAGIVFNYLDNHAGDKFARENYLRNEVNADVLVFGSSKAAHQYVPGILSDSIGLTVYNAGQRGNGIIYEYGRLATIFKRYVPKIIILDVLKGYDLEVNDNSRYLYLLKKDYGTNPQVDSLFTKIDQYNHFKMLFNSYRYNSTICDLLVNNALKNRQRFQTDGYFPLNGSKLSKDKVTKQEPLEIDSIKLYYLERIAMVNKPGCKLIFVVSPTYSAVDKNDYAAVRNICKKHNITLLEYENDERFLGKKELFYDVSHLNDKGAHIFTQIVSSDIKNNIISPNN